MEIVKTREGDKLTLALSGRLDTLTAPELEEVLGTALTGAETLVFDLEKLEYISSAGLRVLLRAQKVMANRGGMKIVNANETVMEVFTVTGFDTILTIE